MDDIANGRQGRDQVVTHSRALARQGHGRAYPQVPRRSGGAQGRGRRRRQVGVCLKSGHDLLMKQSKTGRFVGCSGWPELATSPTRFRMARSRRCPIPAPSAARRASRSSSSAARLSSAASIPSAPPTTRPAWTWVRAGCEKLGLEGGRIMSQRSARTLKRFARCTNYEQCHELPAAAIR